MSCREKNCRRPNLKQTCLTYGHIQLIPIMVSDGGPTDVLILWPMHTHTAIGLPCYFNS